MKKIPIILDCDPGVDDFFAIAIACAYQDLFDLRAITTIGGNNSVDTTTQNALNITKLFNREDVAVAKGNSSYLHDDHSEDIVMLLDDAVVKFHGENGLGNVELEKSNRKIDELPAYEKIYQEALKHPKELVVVCTGPETNLGLAFMKHPDLKDYLKKIVVMGGTISWPGNVTNYAEANIYNDIEAASVVFTSGVPVDMVGLNVTRKAPLTRSIYENIDNVNETIKDIMLQLIEFRKQETMHDAIAMSSLVKDDIVVFEDAYISICDEPNEMYGATAASFDSEYFTFNARVAVDINIDNYYALMVDMLKHYN